MCCWNKVGVISQKRKFQVARVSCVLAVTIYKVILVAFPQLEKVNEEVGPAPSPWPAPLVTAPHHSCHSALQRNAPAWSRRNRKHDL